METAKKRFLAALLTSTALILFSALFFSCAVSETSPSLDTAAVYVSGTLQAADAVPVPVIWKNSTAETLPVISSSLGGTASGIAVTTSGTEYACGSVYNAGGVKQASLWQDGTLILLSVPSTLNESAASGIAADDSAVYIAGYTTGDAGVKVPCYWSTGGRTDLSAADTSRDGEALSVYITSEGYYIGGYTEDSSGTAKACYWTAGGRTDLDSVGTLYDSAVSSVYADGNTVYAAGYSTNDSGIAVAGYWIGGTFVPLTDTEGSTPAYAADISLLGSSAVVSGIIRETYGTNVFPSPVYWMGRNFSRLQTFQYYPFGEAEGHAVYGDEYAVCGYVRNIAGTKKAALWKNGTLTLLSVPDGTTDSEASDIAVTD